MEAVYYNSRKGGMHYSLAFIAMLILLLLNASCCGGAAVGILVKSNTTFGCNGRLEECSIMEDDLELELLMNPYISRILDDHQQDYTGQNPDKSFPCGKKGAGEAYTDCINKIKAKQGQHQCEPTKSKYNRNICSPGGSESWH